MAATVEQLRINALHKLACQMTGHSPSTIKHRALLGTLTNVTAGGSTNTVLRPRSGNKTLETTTDYQVWVVWTAIKARGSGTDGGDSSAGREGIARFFGQCPAIDINNNPITLTDDDWVVNSLGQLMQIENPVISSEGGYYSFAATQQR